MKDTDKIFKALVALSEVVYDLVGRDGNYSKETAEKLSKALSLINQIELSKGDGE